MKQTNHQTPFVIRAPRFRFHGRGLGIIELVVAVAIFVIIAAGIFSLVHLSLNAQRHATLERRATLYAAEALDVARFERDADWDTFAAEPVDTTLYVNFPGTSADLTTTDPGLLDGIFTRTVTLSNVNRDGSGNIAPVGTPDADARYVEIAVSWTTSTGATRSVAANSYLMAP